MIYERDDQSMHVSHSSCWARWLIFCRWHFFIPIIELNVLVQLSVKFVPKASSDKKPPLVWLIAWCWRDEKPLPEPMMTNFTDIHLWLAINELKVWLLQFAYDGCVVFQGQFARPLVGVLKQFLPYCYFPNLFQLWIIGYILNITFISDRCSCSDTCQIWMWCQGSVRYFCTFRNGKINWWM